MFECDGALDPSGWGKAILCQSILQASLQTRPDGTHRRHTHPDLPHREALSNGTRRLLAALNTLNKQHCQQQFPALNCHKLKGVGRGQFCRTTFGRDEGECNLYTEASPNRIYEGRDERRKIPPRQTKGKRTRRQPYRVSKTLSEITGNANGLRRARKNLELLDGAIVAMRSNFQKSRRGRTESNILLGDSEKMATGIRAPRGDGLPVMPTSCRWSCVIHRCLRR